MEAFLNWLADSVLSRLIFISGVGGPVNNIIRICEFLVNFAWFIRKVALEVQKLLDELYLPDGSRREDVSLSAGRLLQLADATRSWYSKAKHDWDSHIA